MLTAEKRVVVQNKKGFGVYEWHKAAGARNESFDCRVYARAALRKMSPKDDIMLKRIYTVEPWLFKPRGKERMLVRKLAKKGSSLIVKTE
jgi:phage terminase large subunit GpA-like protein